MNFLNNLWQLFSDLLFPPYCVKCERPGIWFCPTCLKDVVYFPAPHCMRCDLSLEPHQMMRCTSCYENQFSYLEGLRVVGPYAEPLLRAIHALKYEKRKGVAKPLGKLMAQCWQERAGTRVDGLLPVPLHPERERERGFNQSALLAESMMSILDIPVRYDLLWRTRATESQVRLDAQARQDNMLNAFAASAEVAGKRWLLVDDVTTTGATLEACAQALSQQAARSVWAITLARPYGKS
jgi:ComF family protein